MPGVFAANFWPANGTYSYALAGFRAFRDFDGSRRELRRHFPAGNLQQRAKCGGLCELEQQHSWQVCVGSHQSFHQFASNRYRWPIAFRHRQALADHGGFRAGTKSRPAGVHWYDAGERLVFPNHAAGVERKHHRRELASARALAGRQNQIGPPHLIWLENLSKLEFLTLQKARDSVWLVMKLRAQNLLRHHHHAIPCPRWCD